MLSEAHFQETLASSLLSENYTVLKEVPYKHKRIDIVTIKSNIITTIEIKLQNWNQLINQASQNLVFSDLSYIAIPFQKIKDSTIRKLEEKAVSLNLGIILIFKDSYKIILKATSNPYKFMTFYNEFCKNISRCINEI